MELAAKRGRLQVLLSLGISLSACFEDTGLGTIGPNETATGTSTGSTNGSGATASTDSTTGTPAGHTTSHTGVFTAAEPSSGNDSDADATAGASTAPADESADTSSSADASSSGDPGSTTGDGSGPSSSEGGWGTASEASGMDAESGTPPAECAQDTDCKLIDDCCTCEAVPTVTRVESCDLQCLQTTCLSMGYVEPAAACEHGRCIVRSTCLDTGICDS